MSGVPLHIIDATPTHINDIARIQVDSWQTTFAGMVAESFLKTMTYESSKEKLTQIFAQRKERHPILICEDNKTCVGFAFGGGNRFLQKNGRQACCRKSHAQARRHHHHRSVFRLGPLN